jgi:dTDP-4-dehydrorhamnose reductase
MKTMITGASGAVGIGLKAYLESQGHSVITWNRSQVPINNYQVMEDYVRAEKPDVFFHLATNAQPTGRENEGWFVNYEWTSELAWICRVLGVRFLFTSSVMVFTNKAKGPFTLSTPPDEIEGYGYEKRMAEQRTLYQNPDAIIARLGWQIGEKPGTNNMIDFFETQMRESGEISASRRWYPACSFITDTVSALVQLAQGEPGLYLVDSNTRWTFYEIAAALNQLHGNHWHIVLNDDFVYDQRMIDERVPILPLSAHLPSLS